MAVLEDTATPAGNTVTNIIGTSITDVDSSALKSLSEY
jgi:uncharacterized protein YejL (UPF0352 family)